MEERMQRLEHQVERLHCNVSDARAESRAHLSETRDLIRDLRREVSSTEGTVMYGIGLICFLSFVLFSSSCSVLENRLDHIRDAVNDLRWKN
jgi:hypothetical protein